MPLDKISEQVTHVERIRKMGLAASQARFLCLTARKANCEYKSTALAQEKLNITERLAQISNDYSQAMNATKLVWCPDGMDRDFGLTYSLLMTPSAANDYNPYMVTTPSGAIVLNTAYKEAAEAAGIGKTGGIGTSDQRNRFIQALVGQGVVTEYTSNSITGSEGVAYNSKAGMGDAPKIKGGTDAMTLDDIILSEKFGKKKVDLAKIKSTSVDTEISVETQKAALKEMQSSLYKGEITDEIINQVVNNLTAYKTKNASSIDAAEVTRYEKLIDDAKYYKLNDEDDASLTYKTKTECVNALLQEINNTISTLPTSSSGTLAKASDLFNVKAEHLDFNKNDGKPFSLVMNGFITYDEYTLKNLTLGDILNREIVLMSNDEIKNDPAATTTEKITVDKFVEYTKNIFDTMVEILGYSTTKELTGQGLNVDSASADALALAYQMVNNVYLNKHQIQANGSSRSDSSMIDNSAYQNAVEYNRIGGVYTGDSIEFYGVSLSGMLKSFLTYYENALSGAGSDYYVGKSRDTSVYVTDNSAYLYMCNELTEDMEMKEKNADFFDQLYNNIVEHGWRYDSSLDDDEYFEAVIKNGRYSLTSLNADGYYYQTRYTETGYMDEVADTDAIARAEAQFTAQKAELTYKEDTIDFKTKQLDAEIAAITTEFESVRNIITKTIEKTFSMFSS